MMRIAAIFAGVLALVASAASAQPLDPVALGASVTGQPTAFEVTGIAYVVDGYRSAKWGMTPDQVRAAIARDLPGAQVSAATVDPVDRTTLIVASVAGLSPGPGPAAITYVFGAKSGRLFHVNIDWHVAQATDGDRTAFTDAGARVVQDYIGHYWKLMTVSRGIALGPNALSLFAATAEAGGLVEVRLQGVGYVLRRPDGTELAMRAPPPGKPVLLHVGLAQSETPDVYRIAPGAY